MSKRPTVAVAIDYTLRIPDFVSCYEKLKAEIFVGAFAQTEEMAKNAAANTDMKTLSDEFAVADASTIAERNKIEKDPEHAGIDKRNFWHGLNETDPEAIKFYQTVPNPTGNMGTDFDMTYAKYFYNNEHRVRFLQEYSFTLFGTGQPTNKSDIDIINTAQSKLCDVILFDRTPFARKELNTFAFLSRSGIYVKGIMFVTSDEDLKVLKGNCVDSWDPRVDPTQCIDYPAAMGQPTQKFLDFFMNVEKIKQ